MGLHGKRRQRVALTMVYWDVEVLYWDAVDAWEKVA